MPLLHKPHTASVKTVAETVNNSTKVVTDHTYADEDLEIVRGHRSRKTPFRIMEEYAVDCREPALFLFDIEDVDKIKMGDRLSFADSDEIWKVLTVPRKHDADTITSHASVVLEAVLRG
jgi:hypothetical protein